MEEKIKKVFGQIKTNEAPISNVLGFIILAVVAIIIFNRFRQAGKLTENAAKTGEEQATETKEGEKLEGQVIKRETATYKVATGDNLWEIAEKNYGSGYKWTDIAKANKLVNPGHLLVGQELVLPKTETPGQGTTIKAAEKSPIEGNQYTVVKGDNLWIIAVRAYGDGYRWTDIAKTNRLVNPGLIHPGNILTIPR